MLKIFAFPLVVLLLLELFLPGCKGHPSGYSITVTLKGVSPTDSLTLSRYEGSKPVRLTALPLTSGKTAVSGLKPLTPGMFALTIGERGHFDFLISDTLHQTFTISADAGNLLPTLSFENSPENSSFTEYRRFLDNSLRKQAELRNQMKRYSWSPDSINKVNVVLNKINADNTARMETLGQQFPGSMLALFLRIMKETKIPEPVIPMMVTDRNRFMQDYYMRYLSGHFFDEIDFTDPRIVSIPVYEEKLRYFFYQLIEPVPEETEPKIEMVLEKALANDEVYRFTVKFLYHMFRESTLPYSMQESVFIAGNFVLNDPGRWKDDAFTDNIREKVTKARLNPIGSVATDLKLEEPSGKIIRLSEVKARRIILYFFNPECEACLPITEKLNLIWQKFKNQEVDVFAVYLDRKSDVWKQFISSKKLEWIHVWDPTGDEQIEKKYDIYAIPMIYLLDRNKKIIAKDIQLEKLEEFLQP